MSTLILLTPHSGGLDYDLDQSSNYSSEDYKFVWKNLDSTKARPAYCKHFSLIWVQQWVEKGWKSRLQ
jgi:hypothetical protein